MKEKIILRKRSPAEKIMWQLENYLWKEFGGSKIVNVNIYIIKCQINVNLTECRLK